MNNLLSYCGIVNVRLNASDKDLPVPTKKDRNLEILFLNIPSSSSSISQTFSKILVYYILCPSSSMFCLIKSIFV